MAVQEVAPPVADVRGVEHAVPAVDHVVIDREDHRGGIGGYASGPVSMRLDRTRRGEVFFRFRFYVSMLTAMDARVGGSGTRGIDAWTHWTHHEE